ncbi:MAG: PEP-CTERM sorting domain-containing protein [Gammaproteobacteria bacterium]|nr:PEP-CTERM sorting domain-containing protein [Gammaproteobacteria bacterium]
MNSIKALCFLAVIFFPAKSFALFIDMAGHYVFDSRVDEVIIDLAVSRDVSIEVVSGGVVEGDIKCTSRADDCLSDIEVSGHGAVLGFIQGADANVTLRDYARVGQAGAGSSTGAAVYISDNAYLDTYRHATATTNRLVMTGGYVGLAWGGAPEGFRIDISNGTIGSVSTKYLDFNMSGGRVLNGISGEGINLYVTDGDIWGGVELRPDWPFTEMNAIYGGAFNANDNEYLLDFGPQSLYAVGSDHLTIEGGLFGNINPGSGFNFRGNSSVDIFGDFDLQFDGSLLSGHLLDGSFINVPVAFADNWRGEFNVHAVPEPPEILLFATGILGLLFAHRRRKQSTSALVA